MTTESSEGQSRDWWPLTRLITVGLIFGLPAYFRFVAPLTLHEAWAAPCGLAIILLFIAVLAPPVAFVCVFIGLLPVYGVVLLNNCLYDAPVWVFRGVFRIRSERRLKFLGLMGEVLLFGWVTVLIRQLLSRS